jgi:hypothetical protein
LDDVATAIWLVTLPCAAFVALLVLLLAEPLGQFAFPPLPHSALLSWESGYFLPEPQEEGGYLLALLLPGMLGLAAFALVRARPVLPQRLVIGVVWTTRAALLLLVVACLVRQPSLVYIVHFGGRGVGARYFAPTTLIVGAGIALAIAAAVHSASIRPRLARALRDTHARRLGATALAVTATTLWLLHAINTDATISWTYLSVWYNLPFSSDDTFAVLNGLTPFVDVAPLYASLWPLAAAVPLALFGKTLLVFTVTMCVLTGAALLAIFDLLRRVTHSAIGALALYLPFLATSLYVGRGTQAYGYTMATYFGIFPLRYAGPLLLAALTARALDRPGRRSAWPLFAAAGIVALNNMNFGLPAFLATLVALATRATGVSACLRLVRDASLGALAAILALTCLTMVRAGALPDLGQLTMYTRYFAGGYAALPVPSVLGTHLILFVTYVVAIAVAIVRVQRRELGALTGMLAWSGVFGLGALSYFVAESGPHWLKANFCAWSLAVCLLTVVAVRRLAAIAPRRPGLPELAVLFGIGVMACSVAQLSAPWTQIARLAGDHSGAPPPLLPADAFVPDLTPSTWAFVASLADGDGFYVKKGAPVALLLNNGHRIADAYGIVNVSPYATMMSLFGPSFVRRVVASLRQAGGNTIVMSVTELPSPDIYAQLRALGFGVVTEYGVAPAGAPGPEPLAVRMRGATVIKLVDLRTPHPRAIQGGKRTLVDRMVKSPW